jgi:hypothetical protein
MIRAKADEPRIETRRIFLFTVKKKVGTRYLWQFLDEVASSRTELQYSGYLLADFLFVYHQLPKDVTIEPIDDYHQAISSDSASALLTFLVEHRVDRADIERYLREDGRGLSEDERDGTLDAYEKAWTDVSEWCQSIGKGSFGVIHLSF